MTARYVRSTDGNNADDGSTWALAKADMVGVFATEAAGDDIYVSSVHAESTASLITFTIAGTSVNPVKVVSVNDGAAPPTTYAAGAAITTTGNSNITFNGSSYWKGFDFTSGLAISVNGTGGKQIFDSCNFKTTNSTSSGVIQGVGVNSQSETLYKNCTFYFSGTSNKFIAYNNTTISGGSIKTGSSSISFLNFGSDGRGVKVFVEDFDFSNFSSSFNLCVIGSLAAGRVTFMNCKLPASWTGSLGTVNGPGIIFEMHNCDSADTNYRYWQESYGGAIKNETTLVKTGGATDGTTPFSLKMVSNTNTTWHSTWLVAEIGSKWNSTTGSAITITVDILSDSATNLKHDEIWLEVQYMGTSGTPIGTLVNDTKADILAAGSDQTASSATWTTTGMSNPNKQKLEVTFTPVKAGYISARVFLAKISTTVYIDPVLQVS